MTADEAIGIQAYVEALAASQAHIAELEAERDYARRDQRASEQAATDANRENHQHTQRIAALEREVLAHQAAVDVVMKLWQEERDKRLVAEASSSV